MGDLIAEVGDRKSDGKDRAGTGAPPLRGIELIGLLPGSKADGAGTGAPPLQNHRSFARLDVALNTVWFGGAIARNVSVTAAPRASLYKMGSHTGIPSVSHSMTVEDVPSRAIALT